ncbi:glycosyltransferase family 2 protein [Deinococcus sp. Marseille-Q6407]|uniref:glycosyltransferase family 2 protein n=1 Tax=Deinococcus sp. Marseille-Q6407 TaxID=2969223 RepID=UPI0021C1F816|nr:glycosyltransferase family 2 protein [Deinococcus sp. Marseille-Q6407]
MSQPTQPRSFAPAQVAVIIPAFNEEATVAEVARVALNFTPEVVVVSDGSRDLTVPAAQATGARVLDLQPNAGKGAALYAGLQAAQAEWVIMLDADLIGLTPQHLETLVQPVLSGELDMTIGVFEGGKFMSEWGNRLTPQLSGQRACSREWLLSVPRLQQERWPEPAITEHLEHTGLRWDYVELPEMGQVLKEKKRGLVKGVMYRTRMYADLLTYRVRRRRE